MRIHHLPLLSATLALLVSCGDSEQSPADVFAAFCARRDECTNGMQPEEACIEDAQDLASGAETNPCADQSLAQVRCLTNVPCETFFLPQECTEETNAFLACMDASPQ